MASENETVEAAINRLKNRFDCPNDTKNPINGEWCGACREICTADGKNWCDRNSYLNDVVAIESAWRREKAELVECLKNTMVAMCNYCRSTPEAKGLPCLNGCATMLAAKRLIEVAGGGES